MSGTGQQATAAVTARLTNVLNGAANVWDFMSSPTDPAAFALRFQNQQKLHVYEVTREGSTPDETGSVNSLRRNEAVVIYGYLAYQDGVSEPIFQAEIDSIIAAFDPETSRTFAVETPDSNIEWSQAARVEGPRIARFGQYLVHFVRITIIVEFNPIF